MPHRMTVIVRRGSHVNQTPQTGRAQSGPVTSTSVQKRTPTSAHPSARRSRGGGPRHRPIVGARPGPEIARARPGDDEEAEVRGPGGRDVEVEDALHDAHLALG